MPASSILDAARATARRAVMETTLGTAGLREMGPAMLARAVFSARASSAIFLSQLKPHPRPARPG